ncbi:MAG: hypothetical protein WBV21_14445, partial [Desulfobacterales bacterium]
LKPFEKEQSDKDAQRVTEVFGHFSPSSKPNALSILQFYHFLLLPSMMPSIDGRKQMPVDIVTADFYSFTPPFSHKRYSDSNLLCFMVR